MGVVMGVALCIFGFGMGFLLARSIYKDHVPGEYHDGNTMTKVLVALKASGLSDDQSKLAIGFMQNRGILFRESVKPKSVVDPDTGIGKGSIG